MKTLYLLRHAKTLEHSHYAADVERPLVEEGLEQLQKLSKQLIKTKEIPGYIVSSYATRAVSTALFMLRAFDMPLKKLELVKKLYMAEPQEALDVIHELDPKHSSVMLVGHNPTIAAMAQFLGNNEFRKYPTGTICRIDFKDQNWEDVKFGSGKFRFMYPG